MKRTYFLALLPLLIVACKQSTNPSASAGPAVPATPNSAYFERTGQVHLDIVNPRKKGRVYYVRNHSPDGSETVSTVRIDAADIEKYDYAVMAILLVRLDSGSILVPWMKEEQVLHGGEKGPDVVTPPVQPAGYIKVPIGARITSFILLLRAQDEESGWRYVEMDYPSIDKMSASDPKAIPALQIPDLLKLPAISESPDGNKWWTFFEEANEAFKKAGGKHYATTDQSISGRK